jgi:hypothetical protein
MFHTLLAVEKGVEERSADANGTSAQGKGLENIRSPLEATVDVDLELLEDLWALLPQFQQDEDTCLGTVDRQSRIS